MWMPTDTHHIYFQPGNSGAFFCFSDNCHFDAMKQAYDEGEKSPLPLSTSSSSRWICAVSCAGWKTASGNSWAKDGGFNSV